LAQNKSDLYIFLHFNLARFARKINSLDLTQRVKSVGVSMQQALLVALVVPTLAVLRYI